MNHVQLCTLDSAQAATAVFGGRQFDTPWSTFDHVRLDPGEGYGNGVDAACEQGFVLLDGVVEFEDAGAHFGLASPAVLRFGASADRGEPGIATRAGARLLHIQVDLAGAEGQSDTRAEAVDSAALSWRPAIHGGAGQIATRHIWGPEDFSSTWTFLDHAVLEPGGSVGYHYHVALEECFVVLAGHGRMTVADDTFAVGPGSVTWQGIGQGHGIFNSQAEPLEFLRLAVAALDETFTTVDLDDDLVHRVPDQDDG